MEDLLRFLFTVVSPRDDFLLMVLFWSFIIFTCVYIMMSVRSVLDGQRTRVKHRFLILIRRRVKNRLKVLARSSTKLASRVHKRRLPILRKTFYRDWDVYKPIVHIALHSTVRKRLMERLPRSRT